MFDQKPATWLGAGYTVGAGTITFTNSSHAAPVAVPQLTDAEAHPTTGDIRKLLYALSEAYYQASRAQAANLPTQMTISRSSYENASGLLVRNYTLQFVLDPSGGYEVTPEPV